MALTAYHPENKKGHGTTPQLCYGKLRIQRESPTSSLGIRLSSDCCVTAVHPGSVGGRAGVVVGMRVVEVNGKGVVSPNEMKEAAGDLLEFEMEVEVSSAGRQMGVVAAWHAEKGIGFISPDVPIYNGDHVYTGDVFFHSSALFNGRSAAVGSKVAFTVYAHGGRYKARRVTSSTGGTPKPVDERRETDAFRARAGIDIAAIVDKHVADSGTPLPEKRVCMRHCAGSCFPGDRCSFGLHLDKNRGISPHVNETKNTQEKKCEKYPPCVRFVNVNNLGESNEVVFTANRASETMSYRKNGVIRPEFKRLVFNLVNVIEMPEIGRRVTVPSADRDAVLTGLKRLADWARVQHNICKTAPPVVASCADDVLTPVSKTRLQALQQFVSDSTDQPAGDCWCGSTPIRIAKAWRLKNEALEWKFRCTEYNFTQRDGKAPKTVRAFHGTSEANVLSIASNGFDPLRRSGQAYGEGEYFAQNPSVSEDYCAGGSYMFICKLLLGSAGTDYQWVPSTKYYVVKQRDGNVQALPMYLIQFRETVRSPLALKLGASVHDKGRREGGTLASETRHLWVGWVDGQLAGMGEQALLDDMQKFLKPHSVVRVKADRNGARVGVFVELRKTVTRFEFAELNTRLYRGKHRISVDDAQSGNPCTAEESPKLLGSGRGEATPDENISQFRKAGEACSESSAW